MENSNKFQFPLCQLCMLAHAHGQLTDQTTDYTIEYTESRVDITIINNKLNDFT